MQNNSKRMKVRRPGKRENKIDELKIIKKKELRKLSGIYTQEK